MTNKTSTPGPLGGSEALWQNEKALDALAGHCCRTHLAPEDVRQCNDCRALVKELAAVLLLGEPPAPNARCINCKKRFAEMECTHWYGVNDIGPFCEACDRTIKVHTRFQPAAHGEPPPAGKQDAAQPIRGAGNDGRTGAPVECWSIADQTGKGEPPAPPPLEALMELQAVLESIRDDEQADIDDLVQHGLNVLFSIPAAHGELPAPARDALQHLSGEVRELLNIISARAQIDAGFKGMGVNIITEKAGKFRGQCRRVERLLDKYAALSVREAAPAREARLEAALRRIVDWSDCQCEHDDKYCCALVADSDFHCPGCIAACALRAEVLASAE